MFLQKNAAVDVRSAFADQEFVCQPRLGRSRGVTRRCSGKIPTILMKVRPLDEPVPPSGDVANKGHRPSASKPRELGAQALPTLVAVLLQRNCNLSRCKERTLTISGISGSAPIVMSGASRSISPQQKMTNLYQGIDTSGTGSITKDQLSEAFQTMNPPAVFQKAGVDAVFSQLDPNGTGTVSQSDFVSGMKSLMVSLRASANSLNSLGD